MNNEYQELGALIDDRPAEAKEKDYFFEETVTAVAPVTWVEKTPDQWRKFPVQNQDGSGSCVAQTLKKMIGVYVWLKTNVFVKVSASHIFQRRANRPASGMAGVDAFEIGQEGVTLEEFAPSDNMTDTQMDSVNVNDFMASIGKAFAIGNYLQVKETGNIDTIASIIQQTGKAVMVWFYFSNGLSPHEWKAIPEVKHPDLPLGGSNTARHSVPAVDFTLLGKTNLPKHPQFWGKKAIIVDESWGILKSDAKSTSDITDNTITINGQHIITEDWFKARNWFVGHFMNFAFEDKTVTPEPVVPKPHHQFNHDLEFVPVFTVDPEVIALQDILKYEGCFADNIASSGWYGAVTRTAVGKFQIKHGVVASSADAGFGRVGPKTRAVLNSLYA